jgi:phage terminase large subunit-like protein
MAVQPLSDAGRAIVALLAAARSPMPVSAIEARLRRSDLRDEVAALVRAGTVRARSSLSEAQAKAELDQAWRHLVEAQRAGGSYTFRTANSLVVELSQTGRAVAALLAQGRP